VLNLADGFRICRGAWHANKKAISIMADAMLENFINEKVLIIPVLPKISETLIYDRSFYYFRLK
jgi:hypothetical protein